MMKRFKEWVATFLCALLFLLGYVANQGQGSVVLPTSPVQMIDYNKAQLIKKELGLKSGSGVPQRDKVGQLSQEQLTKIAEIKMPDLNANDIEAAKKIVAGTARSMGVTIAE